MRVCCVCRLLPQHFSSSLSQYLDKFALLICAHLLAILAPRALLPHETPSSKPHKLYKQDPRALVTHMAQTTMVGASSESDARMGGSCSSRCGSIHCGSLRGD